jgi:hypothetical protein
VLGFALTIITISGTATTFPDEAEINHEINQDNRYPGQDFNQNLLDTKLTCYPLDSDVL